MKTYLLNLWDAARTSYWFVPSLLTTAALMMAFLMPMLDNRIAQSGVQLPKAIQTTTESAHATLSAMAGAMVTVTGTVFSITIVTLSLTSQQFGPRLLRRFMYDLPTQVTLGVFLSTALYCLVLLRVIEFQSDAGSLPHLSVFAAVLLAVLSMAMLILFIHHVAMLIQAPHVVAAVARDLDDAIVRIFPEKIGKAVHHDEVENNPADELQVSNIEKCAVVESTLEGYIQAIDGDGLMQAAVKNDLVLRLRSRPGDFISPGSHLADLWQSNKQPLEDAIAEEATQAVNEAVIVGLRRTPRQDVECAVNELVEIAVRSLSPGINDPFTAMNCIDRLGAVLGRLAERKVPAPYRLDEQGCLRVISRPVSFPEVLDAAFNQIRQYGRDSVSVTIRLLETLESIEGHLKKDVDRAAVRRHAEMVARHVEVLAEKNDQQDVQERFDEVLEQLSETRNSACQLRPERSTSS